MSSLSSTSSLAEVQAAYDDNASYTEDESGDKCRAYITACRILLRRSFKSTAGAGLSVMTNMDQIAAEMKSAQEWIHENGSGEGFDILYPGQATE